MREESERYGWKWVTIPSQSIENDDQMPAIYSAKKAKPKTKSANDT